MNPQDYNQNPYVAGGQNPQNPQNFGGSPVPPQISQNPYPQNGAPVQNGQFYGGQNAPQQFSQPVSQGFENPQQPIRSTNQGYNNFSNGYGQNIQPQQQFPQPQPMVSQNNYGVNSAQNLMPSQNYSSQTTTENPYTVDYLNKIAPKKEASFWTKGKIALFVGLGISLIFALFLIFSGGGNRADDSSQAALRAYYHISNLKTITQTYQKRIKNSDLAAVNSGLSTSLASNEQALKAYLDGQKIKVPTGDAAKKSKVIQEVDADYAKLNQTLDDAFLNATIDSVYVREMSYQLSVVKNLFSRRKKATKTESAKTMYEKVETNLEEATKQIENSEKVK